MKNPLYKRLPRELKHDFGKYAVVFLFMVATIGFVSGFLVADNSMKIAYSNSFDEYNIEDGHFALQTSMTTDLAKTLQEEGVTIFENFYKEERDGDFTYRIFQNRTEVNAICLMDGHLAEQDDEIVIDRLFAENNAIAIGDKVSVAGQSFTVCGLVAFSDYSALFRSNTDMMFDAQKFTVAAVTADAFDTIPDTHLTYCYAWTYDDSTLSDEDKHDRAEELMTQIALAAPLTDFVPEEQNQAIHFAGDDMGSDESMMICLLYIVIVIMAFVFAVTTANTIEQEATVIGTLRASGYTKGELLRHYLTLPVLVTLIGAGIGNLLGYTLFKNVVVEMYYGSYSLPAYTTIWSGYAFVMTTVVPCVIMLLINVLILTKKLALPPLQFLRRELKKHKKKKAVRLPPFRFMVRFHLRILLQNLPGYGIMFVGVLFANLILLFGLMMTPLLQHYKTDVIDHMICDYQYVLKTPALTAEPSAEKYALVSLETDFQNKEQTDEVTVYGIQKDSAYWNLPSTAGGVLVSDGILEKYRLKVGDTLPLKIKYEDTTYSFRIAGSCTYPASLTVFMDIDQFRDAFDKDDDYFSGYFSDTELTDLDEQVVASTITQSDMTILADQLFDSMGNMFPMVSGFAVLLYMLLVYLLSKIIIEKNAAAVSMIKILGYQNGEVTHLYVASTAVVVLLSLLISLPLCYGIIQLLFVQIISSFSGWISFYIDPLIYVKMILLGIAAYTVVGALQFRKIKRIPMEEALKNNE